MAMISERLRESYDALPYTSRPVPQSHPDRLHVMAHLHGLDAAPVTGCRVLELGCAAGGNLLPMAAQLPDSEFVGVDLSERQCASASADASALGLSNVSILNGDIVDPDLAGRIGRFDYVIAHGLYSWVPQAVQQALPATIARLMADDGVAYVSYNTYPGWRQRGLVRRFLLDAVAELDDPVERAAQARSALDLWAETEQAGGAYAAILREERERVAMLDDSFLLHDLLEAENHPVWFEDFNASIEAAGLLWMSESNLSVSRLENFPQQLRLILAQSVEPTAREQRIDFWLNRSLRESLLCRAGRAPQRNLMPTRLAGLWATTALRPDGPGDPQEGAEAFYTGPGGLRIGLRAAAAKRALDALAADAPLFVRLADLNARTRQPDVVTALMIDLFYRNLVELSPRQPDYVIRSGSRPRAAAVARRQAREGAVVTNQRHQSVTLDDEDAARLLPLLDGRQDRAGLRTQFAAAGGTADLDVVLDALARQALLVG